jgi:S1-C subfamily serine protease
VVPKLIKDGRYIRPALGVTAGSAPLHQALKLPKGVAIVGIGPRSPAAEAGLQPFQRGRDGRIVQGDVITALNDEAIGDLDDMLALLEKRQVGERVNLTVWNKGKTRRLSVVLGASSD